MCLISNFYSIYGAADPNELIDAWTAFKKSSNLAENEALELTSKNASLCQEYIT